MPTYDYECSVCGHRFEAFQKMTDEPLKKCPSCEGGVRRLIGAGCGLIFKGSGFYITDYKKNHSCGDTKKSEQPNKCEGTAPACNNCPKQEKK